jgi:hypothetical protein
LPSLRRFAVSNDDMLSDLLAGAYAVNLAIFEIIIQKGLISREEAIKVLREAASDLGPPDSMAAQAASIPIEEIAEALGNPNSPHRRRWIPEVIQGGKSEEDQ